MTERNIDSPWSVEKKETVAIEITGVCKECGYQGNVSELVGYISAFTSEGIPNPLNDVSRGNSIILSIELGNQKLRELHDEYSPTCDGLLFVKDELGFEGYI